MEQAAKNLARKQCIPCEEGVSPLDAKEQSFYLKQLGGNWQIIQGHHLYKKFIFTNFIGALNFANKIAKIAEAEGHHPDLKITWGACEVEIYTHKINGLVDSDFYLAAKIEELDS